MPSVALAARGLRPLADLARDRPHGERLRYMAGCRCQECRRANTQYEIGRAAARKAGDWNGIVPAEKARAHMAALSALGVGRRTVQDVTGIADTVLTEIIAGRKARIRARTERKILAVTEKAAADGAYIDGAPTWKLLDELIADGHPKTWLARALGSMAQTPSLQLKRNQVTVRHAADVERLHLRLRMEDAKATFALLGELSDEGFHSRRVRKMLVELAAQRGADTPDLTVRKGRIRAATALLVQQLHARLTGE